MLQEDSNGETSFEIIDKKNGESSNNTDKTESISSVSSPYSIPSPSVMNLPGGNLLSNLPPPSALPSDLTLWQTQPTPVPAVIPTTIPPNLSQEIKTSSPAPVPIVATTVPPTLEHPFIPSQFSAAIPPSKGIQHGPSTSHNIDTENQHSGGGLIGWMKEAVSSGGILSKVAEKATNSIQSVITTLDPQMSEFIHSGGDVEIVVASQESEEVLIIRDVIYQVFGKAWFSDTNIQTSNEKYVAVGFDEGLKRVEERINVSLLINKAPTIGIEHILLHQHDEWFSLYVVMLKDTAKQLKLYNFSYSTPVPVERLVKEAEKEMPEYAKLCDSTEKLISAYLQMNKTDWQSTISGVSKKDTLYTTAKVLVNVYKNKLAVTKQ